eukprot:6180802-Pleurochrysis_carterae.AAC.5
MHGWSIHSLVGILGYLAKRFGSSSKRVGSCDSIQRGSALWLLTRLLRSADIQALTCGKKVSAFFTAYALSSPLPNNTLNVVLPTANKWLTQSTGMGWRFQGNFFDALSLEPSFEELSLTPWFEKTVIDNDGNQIKKPWDMLCQHFKDT